MKHPVHIEQDEDGWFAATCPSLPRAEARRNIGEAAEAYIESLRKHGELLGLPRQG